MGLAVNIAKGAVLKNSPVYQGIYRAGITTQVLEQVLEVASSIKGSVFSQDEPIKVAVIETGRAPGRFAPVDVITRWVQLVIRPPANLLRSVSFLVNRAIARRGIRGRFVFQRSFEETEPQIQQLLGVDLPASLAAKL